MPPPPEMAMTTNRGAGADSPGHGKSIYHQETITPEPRDSLDSAASTTPLKSHTSSPQLHRRRTFSPREAVTSLRQHLHGSRGKRGSVYSIVGRTSTDASGPVGPEQLVASPDDGTEDKRHGRKNSVASSFVGSIRGLARSGTVKSSKATSLPRPSIETTMPADPAAEGEVPLPSSPINIPSAAPVLGLDLGTSGMGFEIEDTRKLQDPANFGIEVASHHQRKTSLPYVPDEVKAQYTHPAIRHRAGDGLLRLPLPAPPATPLPGATLGMELDGTAADGDDSASSSSTASDGKKSRVFERSVTPTTQKDRKELRRMYSLDALAAEACSSGGGGATARKDSLTCETVREETMENPFSPVLSIPSTGSRCPSDMGPLERQQRSGSGNARVPQFALGELATPTPVVEDPFDDSHVVASGGPPSLVRSVRLPLRLKVKGPSEKSDGSRSVGLGEGVGTPTPVVDEEGAVYSGCIPQKSV